MNNLPIITKTNGDKPKDALTEYFQRAKKRALLSPMISDTQKKDLGQFVEAINYNNLYQIWTGILVIFHSNKDFGSFYPHWVLQSAFISKAKMKPVKLELLTSHQREAMVNLHGKIIATCSNWSFRKVKQLRLIQKTAIDLEWQVPFSDGDIEGLDKVFQDLIRRKRGG